MISQTVLCKCITRSVAWYTPSLMQSERSGAPVVAYRADGVLKISEQTMIAVDRASARFEL